MNINTIKYDKINEIIHSYESPSGLKAFVIPKKGYSKKYATYSTHYGSINNEFIIPGETGATRVPDGIAHFLEHKLFEQKDGSVMDKFSKLGSSPNAYTGFNQTVYLFSCTDRFMDNFKLLIDFVQNPYITEESVEKEKGIIGQEIKMYEDDPGWRSFFGLLKCFYEKNPVSIDIAGTVESIAEINRDVLYKCYNTFYHPSNMVVLVVGDVDEKEVFSEIEKGIEKREHRGDIKRIFPVEDIRAFNGYNEIEMPVSMPLFQMGYKDANPLTNGIDALKSEICMKLILEMTVGRSSAFYNQLYAEGLINNSFEADFTNEENYAFSMFGGESKDPIKVRDRLFEETDRIKKAGMNVDSFERIRRAMKGRFIKGLNSVERISHAFVSVYFKGVTVFDYFDVYDTITFEYAKDMFNNHFNTSNFALSVVKPITGGF